MNVCRPAVAVNIILCSGTRPGFTAAVMFAGACNPPYPPGDITIAAIRGMCPDEPATTDVANTIQSVVSRINKCGFNGLSNRIMLRDTPYHSGLSSASVNRRSPAPRM